LRTLASRWTDPIIGYALLLTALAPLSIAYCAQLWRQPCYWLPLLFALPAAAFLLWRRHDDDSDVQLASSLRKIPLVFSCLLALTACGIGSPWFAFTAFLAVAVLGALALGGRSRIERALAASLILLPLLHLPFGLNQTLGMASRTAAARGADKLLDLWTVFHVTQGGAISVSDRTLTVSEPANANFALLMVACVAAFVMGMMRRPAWLTAVVLLSVPICVATTESVRLATAARIVEQFHRNADHALVRAALTSVSLIAAVVLALSVGECLRAFAHLFCQKRFNDERQRSNPPPVWTAPFLGPVAVIAFVVQTPYWISLARATASSQAQLSAVHESVAPNSFLGSPRTVFRHGGDESGGATWEYARPNGKAMLQLNSRVADWFEPFARLRDAGWIIGERQRFLFSLGGREFAGIETKLTRPSTGHSALVFLMLCDSRGLPAPGSAFVAPYRSAGKPTTRELLDLLTIENDDHGPYVGVQLFMEGLEPFEKPAADAAREFFAESCRRILATPAQIEAAP